MTRKTVADARPAPGSAARHARVKAKAAAPAPAVAPSTLRRDLSRQASRFALLTAMALAAGATLAPGEARADCPVVGGVVQCGPTTTTNSTIGDNPPNDRAYVGGGLTVAQGAVVNGAGLALTHNADINAVNNGTIRVDPGVSPTAGGASALNLTTTGNIVYSGGGDVINGQPFTGAGIEAISTNGGFIAMDVRGDVSGSRGIIADTDGTAAISTSGDVAGTYEHGIRVRGRQGVLVNVNGSVHGELYGVEMSGGTPNTTTEFALTGSGRITTGGGAAVSVRMTGQNNTVIDFDGEIAAGMGDGVSVYSQGGASAVDIDIASVSAGTGSAITVSGGINRGTDIDVAGDVEGGGYGVLVGFTNGNGATDLTVGGTVSGDTGIEIANLVGAGDINIDVAGSIVGRVGDGVSAFGRGSHAIRAGAITAAADGIDIVNQGGGDVIIEVGEIVAGADGVRVRDTAAGGDISVATATVYAGRAGIDIVTAGIDNAVTVDVGGDVVTTGAGPGVSVVATAVNSTNNVQINVAGAVTGRESVYVTNASRGDIGISVQAGATAYTSDGITAHGRRGVSIEAGGDLIAHNHGIVISGGALGGALSLTGGANVTGAQGDGVNVRNDGAASVTVDVGDIQAGLTGVYVRDQFGGGDIAVRTGSIGAGASGVNVVTASGSGNVLVETGGAVTAQVGPGILAGALGAGSTSNVDVVARAGVSGETGITVFNEGAGDIRVIADGPVVGRNGDGVRVDGRAELNISLGQSVTGAANGVYARARGVAPGGLNVSGGADIVAQAGDGLHLINEGAGEVFVNVGDITATGGDGVHLTDTAAGGDITVTTGSVTAPDGVGMNVVSASATADVAISVSGDVRGGTSGITAGLGHADATGDVVVNVNGDVSGADGATVFTFGSGDVSFSASGVVTASQGTAVNVGTLESGAVNVRVGSVDAGQTGLSAASNGGDVSVVATGAISARDGDGVVAFTQGAGAVTLGVAGPIRATGGSGVRVLGDGRLTVRTGSVTADENGILAESQSLADDIVIVADGDVFAGDGYYGIDAEMDDDNARGDIDITARAVEGDVGIYAEHDGLGDIRIRAGGDVTGRVYEGIYARTQGSASVEVDGNVTGNSDAILVRSGASGTGDLSVTGTGSVTSRIGHGVSTFNEGSGTTTIDLSGDIRSDADFGVVVTDTALGGDIRITTGNVSGRDGAIIADSISLQADIDITANGDLTSPNTGVFARLNDVASTGDIRVRTRGAIRGGTGVYAENNGSGDIAIAVDGDIDGGGAAASGVYADGQANVSVALAGDIGAVLRGVTMVGGGGGAGDLSLTGSGSVSGVDAGVEVLNQGSGATVVDLTGAVTATAGDGVRVANADVDGGDIRAAVGAVTANNDGVVVVSDSESANIRIDVRGDIDAGRYGVIAELSNDDAVGDIDITTRGRINGAFGIGVQNDGVGDIAIAALDDITTSSSGIIANGRGAVTVSLAGELDAGVHGVSLYGGLDTDGNLVVSGPGSVTARDGDGIVINNAGDGRVTIDLAGPITATGGDGLYITSDDDNGGDVDIQVGAVVALDGDGVYVTYGSPDADIRITADGPVTAANFGLSAFLANDDATGDITVQSNAAVSGADGVFVVNAGSGDLSIQTSGAVTGNNGYGVYANGHGAIDIVANGAVEGEFGAILVETDTDAVGDITVTGTGAVTSRDGPGAGILNAGVGSVVYDVSGPVVSNGGAAGVVVVSDSTDSGDVTVRTGSVQAASDYGVLVVQDSLTGDATVTANGDVSGETGGILGLIADNAATGDVAITANGAVRGETGIIGQNNGAGDLTIAANGAVTGTQAQGVLAIAEGGAIAVSVAGSIAGATEGVLAQGEGDLSVIGAGSITGRDGLRVLSGGAGRVQVDLTGRVDATNGAGVTVRDTATGGDIIVAAGEVRAAGGGVRGVDVVSQSTTANVTVATRGPVLVTGNGAGVVAVLDSAAATGDIVVRTDGAISAAAGILALNDGSGSVSVSAGAPVVSAESGVVATSNGGSASVQATTVVASQAQATGILAQNSNVAGDGDVTVAAADILASRGVLARNYGSGDTRVTATGTITATNAGVVAIGGTAASGDIIVDVRNVTGGLVGVYAETQGVGDIDIAVRGAVEGSTTGIWTVASADQDVRIANTGTIRNGSGQANDTAIYVDGGGAITLANTGSIIGELDLNADASALDNSGLWTTAGGTSAFRGADDRLTNASGGSIIAGLIAGTAEVANWAGLEQFRNAGRLSMGDGGAGDVVATSANSVFAAGSTLQLDISGQALADLFFTTGTLAIEAGARLNVNFVQPLALNGRYVVARADGGLTGTFDFEDRLLSAFIGLRDGYTATTAYIEVGQLRALAEAALTRNQRETATGVDSLPDGNALKDAVLVLPNDEAARGAFDQLSGEIHPAARRAMIDDSALGREAVLDRLVDDRADGRIWGQIVMAERKTDADENAAEVENDARGLLFGGEHRYLGDTVTVGLAGGWFLTDLSILDRASSGRTETAQALAYMGARMDRWGIRTGVGYARTSTETQREIGFPGFTASPAADYDGSVLQVFVDGGYRLPLHGGYVEPFANVTMVSAETDAFTETGGAQASLSGELKSDDVLISTLGFRFETGRESDFSLRGMAGWRGMSGDLEPIGRHAFAGGETFSVLGPLHSDIGAVANLEGLWRVSPNFSVSAGYDGVFGSEGEDHAVSARMKVAF